MATASWKSRLAGWMERANKGFRRRRPLDQVKSFKEDQQRERAFDSKELGVRSVPVSRIVGSVGRYHDFDGTFRLKGYLPHERLQGIKKAMREGKTLPPVQLYQIKDEYYVLDGNHRVSAAKEFGLSEVDAYIVEFIPSKDTLENILYRERADFKVQTRLSGDLDLTEVGKYANLLRQISQHQGHLEGERAKSVSFEEAAEDWHKTIYSPLAAIVRKGGLIDAFPGRTIADLYTYISTHQWEMGSSSKQYGKGIDQLIANNMEDFRKKMADRQEVEYPEMKRTITAFVLMHVSAKREDKIIEKLAALEDVREVHSVHGSVDLLVKIVLTRDLVSSDAEIIGDFVHTRIRQIPGVSSTQTLIPGYSIIKGHSH